MDSTASTHVCKENLFWDIGGRWRIWPCSGVNKEKLKTEGVWRVRFKFHDGSTKILENVSYIHSSGENIISLRDSWKVLQINYSIEDEWKFNLFVGWTFIAWTENQEGWPLREVPRWSWIVWKFESREELLRLLWM